MTRIFEEKQKALNIRLCEICNQISFTLTQHICNSCQRFPHPDQIDVNDPQANINPFCRLNNMNPGPVPEPLTGLTFIEQLLISRVKVCLSVFKLRGGQYGYHRQVINFNQDVTEFATRLPYTLNMLTNVLIVRRQTDDITSFSEFRVRKLKVWNALRCLIDIHSGYRDIVTIDQNSLDALPDDGSVLNQLTQLTIPDHQLPADEEHVNQVNTQNEQQIQEEQLPLIDLIDHAAAPNLHIPNMRQDVDRLLNINSPNSNNQVPVLPFPAVDPQPINEFNISPFAVMKPRLLIYNHI